MLNLLLISDNPKAEQIKSVIQPVLKVIINVVTDFDQGLKNVFEKRPSIVCIQDQIGGVTGENVARHIQMLLGSNAPKFILLLTGNSKARLIKGLYEHIVDLSLSNETVVEDVTTILKVLLGDQWEKVFIPPKLAPPLVRASNVVSEDAQPQPPLQSAVLPGEVSRGTAPSADTSAAAAAGTKPIHAPETADTASKPAADLPRSPSSAPKQSPPGILSEPAPSGIPFSATPLVKPATAVPAHIQGEEAATVSSRSPVQKPISSPPAKPISKPIVPPVFPPAADFAISQNLPPVKNADRQRMLPPFGETSPFTSLRIRPGMLVAALCVICAGAWYPVMRELQTYAPPELAGLFAKFERQQMDTEPTAVSVPVPAPSEPVVQASAPAESAPEQKEPAPERQEQAEPPPKPSAAEPTPAPPAPSPAAHPSMPAFIAKERRDPEYSVKNPGWERYVGKAAEFRVYRDAGKLRAIQALAVNGAPMAKKLLRTTLEEFAGSADYSITSRVMKAGIRVESGNVGDKYEIKLYRKRGALVAFVVSVNN